MILSHDTSSDISDISNKTYKSRLIFIVLKAMAYEKTYVRLKKFHSIGIFSAI